MEVGREDRPRGNPNGAGVALLAFDAQGKARWSKAFQTQADPNGTPPTALVTDSADELALTGSFLGSIDFGGGALPANPQVNGASPYVAKVSSTGAYVGAHTLPVGGSLAMRADGTVDGDTEAADWVLSIGP